MKKRIGSVLLSLCLLLSLLPTTASADGVAENYLSVHSWDELQAAMDIIEGTAANPNPEITHYDGILIMTDGFAWPAAGGELVIDFGADQKASYGTSGAGHDRNLYLASAYGETPAPWTIPENVTLKVCESIADDDYGAHEVIVNGALDVPGGFAGGYGNTPAKLTVNGTLTVYGSSSLARAAITVNGGATLKVEGRATVGPLTLNKDCALAAKHSIQVDGDLTLGDGLSLTEDSWTEDAVQTGFSVYGDVRTTGSAVLACGVGCYDEVTLSGDLTMDSLALATSTTTAVSAATIPAGSSVSVTGLSSSVASTLSVGGTLSVAGNPTFYAYPITVDLASTGVLKLLPEVQYGSEESDSAITGSGTLALYGRMRQNSPTATPYVESAPRVFGVDSDRIDWNAEPQDYVPLPDNVAATVTVKRMWEQCAAHSWGAASVLAPTCCEQGYTCRFCADCGTELRSDYTAATNRHSPIYEARGDDPSRVGVTCATSGWYSGNVQITATDAFIDSGEKAESASYVFNGSVAWWDGFVWPTIRYRDNDKAGTATAYAVFGDVTISTTFTVSTCAHTGGTATCTEKAICTKCSQPYGEPLDHTGGTATCQAKAVCTRCSQPYGELGAHSLTIRSDAERHYFTCAVCGFDCYKDVGGTVTAASQITDELFAKLFAVYEENVGLTAEQERWVNVRAELGYEPDTVHAYGSDGKCLFCGHATSGGTTTCAHKNTELRNAREADCGNAGYSGDTYCKDCKTTIETGKTLPATGKHSSNGETDCTKAETCTKCSAVLRAAGSHSSNGETDCTKAEVCTKCSAVLRAAGKHTSNGETDCTKAEVCTKCSAVLRAAGKHTSNGETDCTKAEVCTKCSAVLRAAGSHSWNDGTVTTPPTLENAGEKTFTCTVCGATKAEPVAKLARQEVSWMPAGPITVTYGQFTYVRPTAYNDSVEDCVFTYTSSDESVATVDASGKTTIVGVGTTTITAAAPAAEGFAATSCSYTLTVSKAPLTVTAKDKTITYGDAPANDGYTVSGLVNGETASVLTGSPAYAYTYEQFGMAGTYAIHLSGLSAKNYAVTCQSGVLTVEKATRYTLSFKETQLEQVAGHLSAVSALVAPYDATAEVKVEYQVNGVWVDTLPADLAAGSYAIRASLTASENIALDGAYTDATLVVKNGVTVDNGSESSATVGVQLEGDRATLEIDDPAAITDSADGDVTVSIGGVSGAKELTLPAALMTGLSENEKAESLTVTTEDASVKLSGRVLDTVAEAVRSGEDSVTVRLTAVEQDALNEAQQEALTSIAQDAVIVEVALVITHADGSETELHELDGSTELTVPYDGAVPEGKYIVVSYVSSDGGVSYVRATYNAATRQVSFKTDHFSHYALFLSGKNAYELTVVDGSGTGAYLEGTSVTVTAAQKSGYRFTGWTVTSGDVTLTESGSESISFLMPASDVTLCASFRRVSSGSSAKPAIKPQPASPFADVPAGAYCYDAVLWAAEQGITGGTAADRFSPDLACTRAQAVTLLWRAAGSPAPTSRTLPFADVPADAYYASAVAWAVERGVTQGTSAEAFSPDAACTRAQIVTLLHRAMGEPSGAAAGFADVARDAYYAPAVAWAVERSVTQGTSAEAFSPDAACTRAQIVTLLYRAYQGK